MTAGTAFPTTIDAFPASHPFRELTDPITAIETYLKAAAFIGRVAATATPVVPSLWYLCDGSAKSRTTYSALFTALNPAIGNPTVTLASPGVFTLNGHGLVNGDSVYLTTTGALPTGLSGNTLYYVVASATNTFELSATRGGAAINTSVSQSGTHTVTACPYGLGDGSSTFNLPNFLGSVPLGSGTSGQVGATAHTMGQVGGEETHVLVTAELASHFHSHVHTLGGYDGTIGSGGDAIQRGSGGSVGALTASQTIAADATTAGSGTAHNTLPPYQGVKWIIFGGV